MREAVALGFRAHSGWTAAVAAGGSPSKPIILERQRIETADAGIPGSKQPYHAAKEMCAEKAETFVRQCRESSTLSAIRAVTAWVAQLRQSGHTVVGTGILFASGRPLPNLAAILRSHPLIHTAEGEFFREVLITAGEHCSLPVTKLKEREVWERAAKVFRLPLPDLRRRIGELGNSVGPPWRQDEKLASLAAWIVLIESNSSSSSTHSS
jgi:hypothetical protein